MKESRDDTQPRVAPPSARSAFEEMYKRHLTSLKNIVWRYAPSSVDADDLLQEASIKAFRNWDRFDPAIAKFTTWFGVIVKRCAIDGHRKAVLRPIVGVEQRTMESVVDPTFGHDAFSSETHALHSMAYRKPAQVAKDALAWLPSDQREVIELEAEGVTQMQMEADLSEPLGTIKSRVRIARVKLRKALGSRGITAETLFGT